MEIWKPVVGYEGIYTVSSFGRVKRVRGTQAGRMRKLRQHPSGHMDVNLCKEGIQKNHKVHHLVLAAFVGPRPKDKETRHLDGRPDNNRLANLKYGTRSENQVDLVYHGGHSRMKLTVDDVVAIRDARENGETYASIASRYGLHERAPYGICHGKSWRHV